MSALLSACSRGGPVLHWLLKNLINSCSCALPSSKSLENFFPPALSGRDRARRRELERASEGGTSIQSCHCCGRCETDTFQLLQGLVVAYVNPHGSQLFLPQVHVLDGSLVLGQMVNQRLGLTQKKQRMITTAVLWPEKERFNFFIWLWWKAALLTTNSATILDRRYALDSSGAKGNNNHIK